MDENIDNNPQNNQQSGDNTNSTNNEQHDNSPVDKQVNSFTMDNSGHLRSDRNGAAAMAASSRTFLVLGWISAALTAFLSPYFAIAGVTFGVLANRQAKGSGNAVIITNIVLAVVNFLFGLFLVVALKRMMLGY